MVKENYFSYVQPKLNTMYCKIQIPTICFIMHVGDSKLVILKKVSSFTVSIKIWKHQKQDLTEVLSNPTICTKTL